MRFVCLSLLVVLGSLPTRADDKKTDDKKADPAPKLPLGRDTTYVLGPLDNAVVTIPVTMNGQRRAALREAFAGAGMRVAQFVHDVAQGVADRRDRLVVDKPKPDPRGACRQ